MNRRFARPAGRLVATVLTGLLVAATASRAHAETTTYAITDVQGTVVAQMDRTGTVTYTAAYRPYGKQAQGMPQAGPGYTGHMTDPDTGLVYMQARYYDPDVGRFLSVDPVVPAVGNVFNFNRYTYANNNPVRFIDLLGRQASDSNDDKPPCDTDCMRMRRLSDSFSGAINRDTAQQRYNIAVGYKDEAAGSLTETTYSSPTEAAQAFVKSFAKASGVLKLEFGANIIKKLRGGFVLQNFVISPFFSKAGIGIQIIPISTRSPLTWGFIHSHSNNVPGFSYGDIRSLISRGQNGFVVTPNGRIQSFLYQRYIESGSPAASYIYYNQSKFGDIQ